MYLFFDLHFGIDVLCYFDSLSHFFGSLHLDLETKFFTKSGTPFHQNLEVTLSENLEILAIGNNIGSGDVKLQPPIFT